MPEKLHKEQLYEERHFLDYCQRDEVGGRKIEKNLPIGFLDACEKDGLILPLLEEIIVTKNDKGEDESRRVRYYSPFQIYFVSALSPNEVGEDGNLWDGGELWGKEAKEKPRYIKWADWSSFHVDSYKNKFEPESMGVNYFRLADDFHSLLKFIHSFEEEKDYGKLNWDKRRHLTRLPFLEFNLDPFRNGEISLDEFGLTVEKIKIILRNLGLYTAHIDPLEHWFYYVKRHPQWRRDKLKGKSAMAQDLYGLCDLLYEVIGIASDEELPPLPEFINPDFPPYLHERAEYASGSDIKTAQSANKKLIKWLEDNQELISEIASHFKIEHYENQLKESLEKSSQELAEFERVYGGDRRQVSSGSWVTIHPEKNLGLNDLDPITKNMVESMLRQREKMGKKEYESHLKSDISMAIDSRLRDLGRDVSGVAYDISEKIWPLINKNDHEKEISVPEAWREFDRKNVPSDPDYELKRTQFWRKDLVEFQRPFVERTENLRQKQRELGGIASEPRLVFCAVCREKPVKEHHGHNDKQISHEAVCDECFKDLTNKILDISPEEGKNMKYAETMCEYCGEKVIFKFAVGNTISVKTVGQIPLQFRLEYGKLSVQAKCTGCQEINEKIVEWGWHP